ncbi:MAG: hypothetical protein M1840_000968 [Geoglossum simile]|nr:MAG: hypothetical protein M1840_000968 [Geoglossum simile]
MAATIPKPSRPSFGPPTAALPPLPTPKPRKTAALSTLTTNTPQVNGAAAPSSQIPLKPLNRSASAHQTPSSSPMTPLGNSSTSNLPSLARPTPNNVTALTKTIRRSVSAAAFPHPPGSASRIASLPPSPLSAGGVPGTGSGGTSRRSSKDSHSPLTPSSSKLQKPKPRSSTSSQFTSSSTPSLLNGSGDSKSISSGPGGRGSDGLLSLPSPPQSRSSSAEGSYSTAATAYDDLGEGSRGREGARDSSRDSKESSSDKVREGKGNVIVSVRVRPDAGGGDGSGARVDEEWMVDGRRSLIAFKGREGGEYYYDNVFTPHDKNAKIYDSSAKRLVRRVMEGYHGTVFAYGMTGTGKTFSMQGTTTSPGVIPLAITDIFSYIRETPHREFLLRVSYLEIYNEKIHDLLTPPVSGTGPNAGQQEEIKLREDSKRGVYATPLKEEIVQSPTQLLRVIARGDHQRRTGSTQYNARSSRSHAVVQIVVESRERLAPGGDAMQAVREKHTGIVPGGVRVSTLSLIDLAGSERAAESKERRAEGAHINRSLLTLGTVIARLSGDKDKDGNPTDKDGKHLPYRDSKLTRLLQPALSGNSLVSILCTIQIGSAGSAAAATSHTGETLNTLKFAARAKNNIVSHAKKAEEALGSGVGDAGSRVLLERYRMEIQDLRSQLELQAKQKSEEEEREREKEAEQRHGEQMLEMQLARTALKERIEHLNRLILCSKSTGVNASGTFSSLGVHPRMSGMSGGHMSSLSVRSSGTHSTMGARPVSNGSVSTVGQLPGGQLPLSPSGNSEDDDSAGEFGDGTATLAAQVRALQADLADKNRYISTLEKRLLQARRSSQSRTSIGFSPPHKQIAGMFVEDGMGMLLKEKDAEIADLRARLDDKERMVGALRSAARKRDVADVASDPDHSSQRRKLSQGTNGPVGVLPAAKDRKRTESVDEMSRMLDEMMQDRVESGELIKGTRGSLRAAPGNKRDTIPVSMVEPLRSEPLRSPIVCATLVS